MALRPSAVPIKGLIRTPKRGYAIQATVQKITLDPTRPIGNVSFLFSKQGKRLRALQKEISLRNLAEATLSMHATLPNGGAAGLANLETAQKIVASPTLLAQFKKDADLSKKALVSAVAWLKDIRNTKEAEAAAAKIDASTQALLSREVAFSEIVPLRESLGLGISLTQKATVADWYLAYAAAAKLRESNKTYSTLGSITLTVDAEKALSTAATDRVTRQLVADTRKYVLGKSDMMPKPMQFVSGSEFSVPAFNATAIKATITSAVRMVEEAASINPNQFTVQDIVALLMKARNALREVAASLRAEADARQTVNEETLLNDAWTTLLNAQGTKAEVETAANFIQAMNSKANGTPIAWDTLIAETMPEEYQAIDGALAKLTAAVNALPRDLFDTELRRRNSLLDHINLPQFDQGHVF